MQVFNQIAPLKNYLKDIHAEEVTLGFVPTMGALHRGHLSLVASSIKSNDVTLCSIFVNPAQFDKTEDLDAYPRTLDHDMEVLKKEGCDIVFVPLDNEMYPGILEIDMHPKGFSALLEGAHRPGHFDGVIKVIIKLFNIINPKNAYFGLKDLQQYFLVKKLAEELFYNIKIHGVPTVREESGLACSSRNKRLNRQQLIEATKLYKSLKMAKEKFLQGHDSGEVKLTVMDYLCGTIPIELEYFELVSLEDFKIEKKLQRGMEHAICIAARIGSVRLIDNILIESNEN